MSFQTYFTIRSTISPHRADETIDLWAGHVIHMLEKHIPKELLLLEDAYMEDRRNGTKDH